MGIRFFLDKLASDSECIKCWDVYSSIHESGEWLCLVNPPTFPFDLVTGLICGKLFDETVGVLYMVMEHQF